MDATSVNQNQDQAKPAEATHVPRGGGTWSLLLLALPFLYILSIGPAAKLSQFLHLEQEAPGVDNAFGIIYYPITLADQRLPSVHRVVGWYLHVWQVHDI
jgi:hypothetical protein